MLLRASKRWAVTSGPVAQVTWALSGMEGAGECEQGSEPMEFVVA